MKAEIDHLVISGSDLGLLVAWWKQESGLDAARGGSHAGYGTRNALVGVDDTTYVELIAHDPDQTEPAQPRPFGLDTIEPNSVQLSTFMLAVTDIRAAVKAVSGAGLKPGPILAMSRTRPDGVKLDWQLAMPPEQGMNGTQPSLIQWGDGTPHPGSSLAPAVNISELVLGHPKPEPLQRMLTALGSDLIVTETASATLAVHFVADSTDFWL